MILSGTHANQGDCVRTMPTIPPPNMDAYFAALPAYLVRRTSQRVSLQGAASQHTAIWTCILFTGTAKC